MLILETKSTSQFSPFFGLNEPESKDNSVIEFLEALKNYLLEGHYPEHGIYLLLEDASGRFIDEDEVFEQLYLITHDLVFADYVSHLYDEYSKFNRIFKKYMIIAIEECLERQK